MQDNFHALEFEVVFIISICLSVEKMKIYEKNTTDEFLPDYTDNY